ncbi:hypothetical protein K7X08_025155 [Anisodus acutangulus]|uniref:Uncharacterized protein n=1 Tax=Anisodus acutangulus TaxID=402998 RepID=A0A9Q1MD16_9SOLA|nr:hypothetical protein K7X08_025155 [Anisodus acutangulus]
MKPPGNDVVAFESAEKIILQWDSTTSEDALKILPPAAVHTVWITGHRKNDDVLCTSGGDAAPANKKLHDGWDCYIINEQLVCDELEYMTEAGGNIVDHHGCDFFPERWFDRVVVLQTDNTVLYDKLIDIFFYFLRFSSHRSVLT